MTEAIRLPCGGREPPHAKPKGNIMCNGGGAFSPEEVEYLRSLPVVAEATSRRITYTESFKHNCMRRYHAGESPVELFREAGLDPSLIGYKRIERCFARWRKIACRMGTDRLVSVDGNGGVVPSASADVAPSAESAEVARSAVSQPVQPTQTTETQSNATLPAPRNADEVPILSGGDVRDLLIAQQVRRIDELEREAVVLAADGYTNAEIAERMFISERTVKAHISSAGDRLCMGAAVPARHAGRIYAAKAGCPPHQMIFAENAFLFARFLLY